MMVTGDNLLTAVSVARECGMVGPEQEVAVVEAEEPTEEVDGGERGGGVSFRTTERPDRGDRGDGTSRAPLQSLDLDIESGRRPNKDLSTPPPPALAVSGHAWQVVRAHYPHLLPTLAVRGVVFARMKPEQKAQLVEEMQVGSQTLIISFPRLLKGPFQNLDYVASFCGDGANDCGALKAAHVGISLSEAEASVAAPFTSRSPDITCVPAVVREGRCALVTSFGVFKYMALYSIIQFVSVLMLYTLKTNLGDWQVKGNMSFEFCLMFMWETPCFFSVPVHRLGDHDDCCPDHGLVRSALPPLRPTAAGITGEPDKPLLHRRPDPTRASLPDGRIFHTSKNSNIFEGNQLLNFIYFFSVCSVMVRPQQSLRPGGRGDRLLGDDGHILRLLLPVPRPRRSLFEGAAVQAANLQV